MTYVQEPSDDVRRAAQMRQYYDATTQALYGDWYAIKSPERIDRYLKVMMSEGADCMTHPDGEVAIITECVVVSFPFLTERQIDRLVDKLEDNGYLHQAVSYLEYVADMLAHNPDADDTARGFKTEVQNALVGIARRRRLSDLHVPSRYTTSSVVQLCESLIRYACSDDNIRYRDVTRNDAKYAIRQIDPAMPSSVWRAVTGCLWTEWPNASQPFEGLDEKALVELLSSLDGLKNLALNLREHMMKEPLDGMEVKELAAKERMVDDLNKTIRQTLYAGWAIEEQIDKGRN